MKKRKKYNPLKKYAKGGKSTGESIKSGMGTVKEEESYFKPESFKVSLQESPSSKKKKEKGDTEGLLKALGAFSKKEGGKVETDPPKKELTAQQERFIKDLAGKELDAWMNKEKDQTYGHNSRGRVNIITGGDDSSYSYKKGQNVGETKRKFIENRGGKEAYIESIIKDPEYRARLEKKLPDYGKPAKTWTPNIKIKKAKR